jgi:hypothetical protein
MKSPPKNGIHFFFISNFFKGDFYFLLSNNCGTVARAAEKVQSMSAMQRKD